MDTTAPDAACVALRLYQLPDEILSQLLSYKNSSSLLQLWKCGHVALNQKLARAIRSVDLKDTIPGTTSRWPRLLGQLAGLRHLRINRNECRLDTIDNLRHELQRLTPRLETLELLCIHSVEAFMKSDAMIPYKARYWTLPVTEAMREEVFAKPKMQRMLIYRGLDAKQRHEPENYFWHGEYIGMWNVDEAFPHLKSLVLGGQRTIRVLRDVDFAMLPSSLTKFEITNDPRSDSPLPAVQAPAWKRFDLLPRGLQTLRIDFRDESTEDNIRGLPSRFADEDLKHLPPTLTALGTIALSVSSNSHDMRSVLPATITSLDLHPGSDMGNDFRAPSNISDLTLESFHSPDFFSELPSTLTRLVLASRNLELDGAHLAAMPQSIITLQIETPIKWRTVAAQDFPQALTTLICESTVPSNLLALLPKSITQFDALDNPRKHPLSRKCSPQTFPPNISTFHLRPYDENQGKVKISSVRALPRKMDSLWLPTCHPENGKAARFMAALPSQLNQLALQFTKGWDDSQLMHLPSTLTSLILIDAPGEFNYFKALPNTLTNLSHHCSISFAIELEVEEDLVETDLLPSASGCIQFLPASVKHLFLKNISIQGHDIKHLPRGLRSLERVSIRDVRTHHLGDFPPRLKLLDAAFLDPNKLKDSDVKQLPPTLSTINVENEPSKGLTFRWAAGRAKAALKPFVSPDPRVQAPRSRCNIM